MLLNINDFNNEVRISFIGLDADKGMIDIKDLAKSLEGWREIWNLSSSTYFNKELSLKPLNSNLRTQIYIKAIKQGSFDIITHVCIPIALMVGYDFVKSLFRWQYSLLRKHIVNKESFLTKEESIKEIEKLCEIYNIKVINQLENTRVVDSLDSSLLNFVEPIEYSASKIVVTGTISDEPMIFTSRDKRALKSGYHIEAKMISKGYERVLIKFVRINAETGNALVSFENPTDIDQLGHVYVQITDPAINEPKNAYIRAFYEKTAIKVWAKKVVSKRTNNFQKFEITTEMPNNNQPLFDKEG